MTRPLIGVTAEYLDIDIHDSRMAAHVATVSYLRAVQKAGGVPVVLPITTDADEIETLAERLDGVVISGGIDVDPVAYGQVKTDEVTETQTDRDQFEFELIQGLVERNTPTLALCRGIQSLNVALGGSLVQHVDDHMRTDLHNTTAHTVSIDPDSRLAELYDSTTLDVNSMHHQVVDRLGEGCRVVATSPDGYVEALEVDGADLVLGVQWHPEWLRYRPEHLALFERLVADAAR